MKKLIKKVHARRLFKSSTPVKILRYTILFYYYLRKLNEKN